MNVSLFGSHVREPGSLRRKINISDSHHFWVQKLQMNAIIAHSSHFSALTKIPDFSSIFFQFPVFFKFFFKLKTLSLLVNYTQFI